MKVNSKSFTLKFSAFAVLAVVGPALGIALSLILTGRKILTHSIYVQQSQTAQRLVNRVTLQMNNSYSVLAIAAREPGLAKFSRFRRDKFLRRLLHWNSTFQEAILTNAKGMEITKLICRNNRFVPAPLISRKGRREFLEAMSTGKVVMSEPFFSGDRHQYILVSCPLNRKRGVLIVKVLLDPLWEMLQKMAQDEGNTVYGVSRNGDLLLHPDSDQVLKHGNRADLAIVKNFMEGKAQSEWESLGLYPKGWDQEKMAVLEPVPILGWGLVIEKPTSQALAPIYTMQKAVLKWTGLSVFLILVLVLWRVRSMVRPVSQMEEGVRAILRSQPDVDQDMDLSKEPEYLTRSFKRMAESVKRLEDLRKDIVNRIANDLKSPLSVLLGGIDYIHENEGGKISENSKRVLTLVRKSSDDLLQMIQNILHVAKMEKEKLIPRLEQESYKVDVELRARKILMESEQVKGPEKGEE